MGPRKGETARLQGPSGTAPSWRDFECFRLIQRYYRYYKHRRGCFLKQETIAEELGIGLSTVERRIRVLKKMNAIKVIHRGPTSSVYSVLWKNCDTWQCFLKLAVENEGASEKSTDQTVAAENEGASEGAFEGALSVVSVTELPSEDGTASLVEPGLVKSPAIQHYSPLVNDADCREKPSPEKQKPNPKPGSGGNPGQAFDSEVAEVREALKSRPLVRLTPAFDSEIRRMLASGETVETIKRAILRGCWLKLASRDRGDTSLIFSMRYFFCVIADVKPMADPAYWRNVEQRLAREEQKRLSPQPSLPEGEHVSPEAAPHWIEARGAA